MSDGVYIPKRRGSPKAQTQVWSDGIHFVRSASVADKHRMRWVAAYHKVTGSRFTRHYMTKELAIEGAALATTMWLKANADDASHLLSNRPVAEVVPEAPRAPVVYKQAFATTHFDCIVANPYAQVWQCTSQSGSLAPVGRRRVGGRQAEQTPVYHAVGECAVLIGKTPVYEKDGSVRVFHLWTEAEEYAFGLYSEAPEEEVISWERDHVRVGASHHFEIHFNPSINGEKRPFSLYFVEHRRPVYSDRTRPIMTSGSDSLHRPTDETRQQRADRERREETIRKLSRVPSYEERVLLFRTIWAAEEEILRREAMLRGESV